jgi:hypothetical protein
MVSVPKTHPIPQLSIVVPIGRDLASFESSLISVLENQPEGSEVLVAHDGSYDDPFDLADEVRFVVADSGDTVDLVGVAAREARGRFVHVLSEGLRATCGWTDSALECFDHFDTGVVVPVIRVATTGSVLAAGWSDGDYGLCRNAAQGLQSVSSLKGVGAFLQASFWRRDLLRNLQFAFDGRASLEASVAYHYLVRQAGWKTELAMESTLLSDHEQLPWDGHSISRGMRLRAIRNHFVGGGWVQSITASCAGLISAIAHPAMLMEAVGQSLAPLAAGEISRQIHPEDVTVCDDRGMIVTMPQRQAAAMRRAA